MKQVKIIIERASDGTFSAYSEDVAAYGMGDTIEAAKKEAVEGLKLFIELNKPENIPSILKGEYEIVFKIDVQSLLEYYKGIFTNAAFERITGISQAQISHYSTGLKKPRPAQAKKSNLLYIV